MRTKARHLAHGAILAALYAVLTHMQNILVPGSATWAIQLRLSEMLCVLAFFTPAAAFGLSVGCMIFNLTFGGALPLDFFVGPMATYIAAKGMWHCRRYPALGLLLPGLCNGILVGWELTAYIGGGFWMNAGYVAAGELLVLLLPGGLLYYELKKRNLGERIFA